MTIWQAKEMGWDSSFCLLGLGREIKPRVLASGAALVKEVRQQHAGGVPGKASYLPGDVAGGCFC